MAEFITGPGGEPKANPDLTDILSYWLPDGTFVQCSFLQLIEWLKSLGFQFVAPNQPPTNTTPAAPAITANDINNTLQATHALGASEILISTNGGAFVQYDGGVIQVGDVARAPGYWQFKTKAATGSNESPVASSPAFTVAPAAPTWDMALNPGDANEHVEFLGVAGSVFRYNYFDVGVNTTPATMNISVAGNPVASVTYASGYNGRPSEYQGANGTKYQITYQSQISL